MTLDLLTALTWPMHSKALPAPATGMARSSCLIALLRHMSGKEVRNDLLQPSMLSPMFPQALHSQATKQRGVRERGRISRIATASSFPRPPTTTEPPLSNTTVPQCSVSQAGAHQRLSLFHNAAQGG